MRVYLQHIATTTVGVILMVVAGDSGVYAISTRLLEDESPPVICPEDPFANGGYCDGNCVYGLKCCPGEEGECVYTYGGACYCDYFSCATPSDPMCEYDGLVCDDYFTATNCPSVCPEIPANTDDVCYLDAPQYSCKYTYSLVKDEPGFAVHTKECVCTLGKFVCSCSENECPTQCPQSPLVQGDACSVFDGGYCNYTQPCCVQGGEGTCVANSTCFCDEPTGSVNCTTLPMQFCTIEETDSTRGENNRGQMSAKKKKKKLRTSMSKKNPSMHGRTPGDRGR